MTESALIRTAFGAASTAADVTRGIDLSGLRALVTGGAGDLGAETARALTAAGAQTTLAVRDVGQGEVVADRIARDTGGPKPRVSRLDLADLHSVAELAGSWEGPLHLLVNNAGVVTSGLERAPAGLEWQFATNHLGHFALALGLRRALADGARERGEARIVALTSGAHMRSGIDFDDLQFERRSYDPQLAYAQSKTANVLFTVEATRRWAGDGIYANAANPGGIRTGLQRNFSEKQWASLNAAEAAGIFTYKTIEQGAATTLVAAVSPEFARTGGHYLDDCREAETVANDAAMADHPHAVKKWALDPAIAQRLWTVSEALLNA